MRVTIAGAGVFGLATALALLDLDVAVRVLDPEPDGANASAVAAGLLAPVGEALFDPDAAAHYPMMVEALALWSAFAARAGVRLSDEGLIVPAAAGEALARLGLRGAARDGGLWVQADPRVVDPSAALARLRARVETGGGRIEASAWTPALLDPDEPVVLAMGSGRGLDGLAPELARLTPVKGQIAVLPHGPAHGPTLRWPGGYLAPQPGGARVGATMEVGRRDLAVEPEVLAALVAAARAWSPRLDIRDPTGQAGVRMQTADGLPLVGPSAAPGVLLAAGARRNGWLFAPLVGRMIAAYCTGEDPGPWASSLHPARFDRG